MGLFSSSSTSSETPDLTKKSTRALCWEARDSFFACLDKNNIIDAIENSKEATAQCGSQEKDFEKDCVGSWVEYFKQKRTMEYNKAKMMESLAAQNAIKLEERIKFQEAPPAKK
ncbi:hypothetical protein NADFUDRAFT_51079 [Nadsonia fulvescens var. elongata DSM 6958]|uniref:Cytochrome c oxidase, subunit VIb n=1 Tax=Nadsonia fulvescens var. elongata DSM 6958 TaxID=857566 RepID=A0A1E3PK42_9ASCO|nr:hypothetical protein NADFUDRAFT_51079 [Nadsonia fulvescens var. elongata DSM 6958]